LKPKYYETLLNVAFNFNLHRYTKDHPVRRLLTPFVYNTGSINQGAALTLMFPAGGQHSSIVIPIYCAEEWTSI
jgi:hypothetical protein